MDLQTLAEKSPAEILQDAATIIEAENTIKRERKIASVLAAARVWRDDSSRLGAASMAAADAYKMLKTECERVIG